VFAVKIRAVHCVLFVAVGSFKGWYQMSQVVFPNLTGTVPFVETEKVFEFQLAEKII